jgi:hypothetical protein
MPYEVFASLEWAGRPMPVEEIAASVSPGETRVLGEYPSWGAALRMVARLEVEARRQPPGRGGFALGIRTLPPAVTFDAISKGAAEASGCTR